jgi:hypothetical protein
MTIRLSVLYGSVRLRLEESPWNICTGHFSDMWRRPKLVFSRLRISGTLGEDLMLSIAAGDVNWSQQHCCATLNIFVYCWQWHVAQRYAQNASLFFNFNSGYANAPRMKLVYVLCLCCFNIRYSDRPVMVVITWLGNRYCSCTYHWRLFEALTVVRSLPGMCRQM